MYQTEQAAVLIATYEGGLFLREQLDSLLNQTYRNWKAYIHDDGSGDGTLLVIREYTQKYPEKFVLIEGEPAGGARNNFFYLMSQVEAPYYFFCDQDDVWLPEKMERTMRKMKQMEPGSCDGMESGDCPAPCLVFTELTVVNEKKQVICETMSQYQGLDCRKTGLSRLLMQNVVTGCTMLINRALCQKMMHYHNVDNIIMHDWWGAVLAAQYGKIAFLPEPTILYRQHSNNSVGALEIRSRKYLLKRIRQGDKIKKSLRMTRMQAKELAESFAMEEDSLVMKYARSGEYGKIRRLCFYWKNDFKKTNLVRNLGLFVWG